MSNNEKGTELSNTMEAVADKMAIIAGAIRGTKEMLASDVCVSSLADLVWILSEYTDTTVDELYAVHEDIEKALTENTENVSTKNNPKYWLVNTADETDGPNGKE